VAVARVRWAASEAALDPLVPAAGGWWQLVDINRNILTGWSGFFIYSNFEIVRAILNQ
jgi:hypothetical protein